jgi:hypothetical protein
MPLLWSVSLSGLGAYPCVEALSLHESGLRKREKLGSEVHKAWEVLPAPPKQHDGARLHAKRSGAATGMQGVASRAEVRGVRAQPQ